MNMKNKLGDAKPLLIALVLSMLICSCSSNVSKERETSVSTEATKLAAIYITDMKETEPTSTETVDTLIYYYHDYDEHENMSLQLFIEKGLLKGGLFRGTVDEFNVDRNGHCTVGYFVLPFREIKQEGDSITFNILLEDDEDCFFQYPVGLDVSSTKEAKQKGLTPWECSIMEPDSIYPYTMFLKGDSLVLRLEGKALIDYKYFKEYYDELDNKVFYKRDVRKDADDSI